MTKPKRHLREWTVEEKAAALALLAANGGNMKKTVREFRTGAGVSVSESTLRDWRDKPAEQPPAELVVDATRKLDQILESVVGKLATGLDRPEAVTRIMSRPVQAATVLGILVDKLRILRGEATQITEMRTLSGFLASAKWLPEPDATSETRPN